MADPVVELGPNAGLVDEMYRRYQEAQTNPALAKTLDQVRVTPSGDRLKVEAPVSQDQLMTLIQTKAFAAPM